MAIYIPIPEPIEVYQWHKNGDMPGDGVINGINSGEVVGRHITNGHFTGAQLCPACNNPMGKHGLIKKRMPNLESLVCPGNWVRYHRDEKKRIIGYSVITTRVLNERYVDLATIPQPKPEKQK